MKRIILIVSLSLIAMSCSTNYNDNLHKLGERVIIENDSIQVIDVGNYYLELSDGRRVDVHYPIIKNNKGYDEYSNE